MSENADFTEVPMVFNYSVKPWATYSGDAYGDAFQIIVDDKVAGHVAYFDRGEEWMALRASPEPSYLDIHLAPTKAEAIRYILEGIATCSGSSSKIH